MTLAEKRVLWKEVCIPSKISQCAWVKCRQLEEKSISLTFPKGSWAFSLSFK